MPTTNIGAAEESNMANVITDYSVDPATTDGPSDQPETEWRNEKWTQYFGYYDTIPELASAIDAKATWTIGKGFKADPQTTFILDTIKGWGKDTFNTILENCIRTYYIGGDSFCEIIRDDEKKLINIKPLDPDTITIISNNKGIVIRYEQTTKVKNKPKKFKPEDMFHLARNRVADEIHGVSIIKVLEDIILKRNEAMTNYQQVMNYYMKPRYIFHLDTDDPARIAEFKRKMDQTWADGTNFYVPKDTVVPEQISVAPNSTMNPQTWIDSLNNNFFEACGTPRIIVGGSGEFTEATAKIAYLAFQQIVEEEQLFIEEQCGQQLGVAIELEFPASLENELLSDNRKDGAQNIDASETTAGQGQ